MKWWILIIMLIVLLIGLWPQIQQILTGMKPKSNKTKTNPEARPHKERKEKEELERYKDE